MRHGVGKVMSSKTDNNRSLESTLSWRMGLLLLLVLTVLLGIAAWIGREASIQFALSRLHHDAEAILSSIDVGKRKAIGSQPPIYMQPLSGHYYMVNFSDGQKLLSRSLWDQELVLPSSSQKTSYWLTPGPQEQKLLVWQSNYEKQDEQFSITIAEDVASLLSAIHRFIGIGIIASLAAVLLMMLIQRLTIRNSFAQMDAVREDVRSIRRGLKSKINEEVPAEVTPVIVEFNQLLQAWKTHQERSRNSVGNLAHALKSPLSIIIRYAEKQGDPYLAEQAHSMQALLEHELKRARITGRASIGKHFHPQEDIEDLVETIQALHHQKALQIQLNINTPNSIALDQNDMLEMLGNLLDNAAKWAQHKIYLHLSCNGQFVLRLEDDGPGITPSKQETLLARGKRLDENQPGHGLGLAIVNDIVSLYKGEVHFSKSSKLLGLKVTVSLPLS